MTIPSLQESLLTIKNKYKKTGSIYWLLPLMACIVGWWRIAKEFNHPIPFDAEYVYLPAAKAFLKDGWAYLLTPDSYRVAPLAYLWPALWGGESAWIRWANCALWAGCVLAAWRCAFLLGGLRAGVVSVFLLALHPELLKYFPTELTEPIFLFGLLGWLWTLAEWLISQNKSPILRIVSAMFLALTLLSRPVLQLLVPLGLLSAVLLTWHWGRSPKAPQKVAAQLSRQMASILALSLIVPAAVIVKNGLLFGLWGLGTGAGTGLYLGLHPLSQGTEPAFLGFAYDINEFAQKVTGNGDHLSLAADRAASAAAWMQIASMSFWEGSIFFARKLWWWTLHHPASLVGNGSALRAFRIFEWLTLATCATHMIWMLRQQGWNQLRLRIALLLPNKTQRSSKRQLVILMLLAGICGLMLLQLLPILYNSRYSSALLDPWLILLTGFSTAYLLHPYQFTTSQHRSRWSVALIGRPLPSGEGANLWPGAIALPLLLIAAVLCTNIIRRYETVSIDPAHMGAYRPRIVFPPNTELSTSGMVKQPDGQWLVTESPATIALPVSSEEVIALKQQRPYNPLWEVNMTVSAVRARQCRVADVSYTHPALKANLPISRLHLNADGQPHIYAVHGNADLRPDAEGDLRFKFYCPSGTLIRWNGTRLLESLYTEHAYHQLIYSRQ